MVMLGLRGALRLVGDRQVNGDETTRVGATNQPSYEILFLAFATDQKNA